MYYVYVDGESHFHRSKDHWQRLHGDDAQLQAIFADTSSALISFPVGGKRIRVIDQANFFWDTSLAKYSGGRDHPQGTVHRAIYFTSVTGGDDVLHEVRVQIRSNMFEPQVIQEYKKLADQRANLLQQESVIERAKGVDVSLAVRILEDAYLNNFRSCLLLTSDVDFLPVIREVRRMGKEVILLGYKSGLAQRSPLEYEPDRFVDLGDFMEKEYRLKSE